MIYFLSEFFIWLMWFWFISLGCTLVSGQGLCGLTQLHNLDELELTNCPSATREVCLYLRENMAHCLVVDWKTPPTIRVRSYWNLRVKKNPLVITWPVQIFARSHEIFKFCNNLLGSACFLSKLRKWTDEAAGYYNPTPENTYRPFVTKDIDSIFFFNKNSFYDPPTPFSLSSFFMRFLQNILYMYIQISAFCLLPFFWQT